LRNDFHLVVGRRRRPPWEAVPELEIQKRLPSTLENADGRPPWEAVLELEVRERPPSTLENTDGRPPGRRCRSWRSGSTHHQRCKNVDGGPWEAPELEVRKRPPSTL
jgi:hypothetical protein